MNIVEKEVEKYKLLSEIKNSKLEYEIKKTVQYENRKKYYS